MMVIQKRKEVRQGIGSLMMKGLACSYQGVRLIADFLPLLSKGAREPLGQ